ncbi:choice-of-anchor V domain-containing protein [Rubrivirga sp.]|uniref:choice-of-anchor V domain-containing protein n=1 Tax=Rubrivirga sp. TaxID=1885344 RepID=UPI003B51F294
MTPSAPSRLAVALAAVAVVAAVALAPAPAVGSSGGANPGFAGHITRSDGSPQTCNVCHSSFGLNEGGGDVAVEVAGTAAPGEAVPVTVTLDNQTPEATPGSRRQGFSATVRDPETGEAWGELVLTDAAATRYAGGDPSHVTHTAGGTAQSTWTFDWVPGTDRTGAARVYVAGNAANGNGGSSGDYIYTATADIVVGDVASASAPAAAFEVGVPMPNPARDRTRLALRLDRPGPVAVSVVDGRGRRVRTVERRDRPAGASVVEVATGGLAAGAYVVVVDAPGGRQARPLVVVR